MSAFDEALARWSPRITLVLSGFVVILAGVAVYTLVHYQPKTACSTDPAGDKCQQIFEDTIRAFGPETLDTLHHKLHHRAQVKPEGEQRDLHKPDGSDNPHGGAEPTSPSGSGDVGNGGSPPGVSPGPDPSPSPPPTAPPAPTPPSDPPAPPSPPPNNPVDGIQQGLNDTVDGAQGAVNNTVDGLQGTVNDTLNGLHP
jgi:hypothetical protein